MTNSPPERREEAAAATEAAMALAGASLFRVPTPKFVCRPLPLALDRLPLAPGTLLSPSRISRARALLKSPNAGWSCPNVCTPLKITAAHIRARAHPGALPRGRHRGQRRSSQHCHLCPPRHLRRRVGHPECRMRCPTAPPAAGSHRPACSSGPAGRLRCDADG